MRCSTWGYREVGLMRNEMVQTPLSKAQADARGYVLVK